MSLTLASAGDDIKLWESADFIQSRHLNPHDQNVSMVDWASDNSFLASISLHAEDVAITNMKTFEVSTVPSGAGCLCLDLNENSRYMLTGGSDSLISVWDMKSNKVKKKYKGHKGPVTCAKFSAETRFIASGSESGEIILHNVISGQGHKPLVAPNIQAVKQLQYSHHKRSLLGSVSDDGAVCLWDCSAQRLTYSFTTHRAPATALSFSPINDIFLISVGLDKRIACYDVQAKKTVKVMSADAPLTSIDTLSDGVTVAVGSTRGKIYHYDLRMGSVPLKTIDAHRSSVQCLRFQTEGESGNSSKLASTSVSKQAKHRQLPPEPRASAINKDMTAAFPAVDKRPPATGVGDEVFSPLREGFQMSGEEMEHTSDSSLTNLTLNNNNSTDPYSGGIFSPLNENNITGGRGSSGLAMSPLAFTGYSSTEQTNNNRSSLGQLDYNRLSNKGTVPAVKVTHPSVEGMVNGQSGSGQSPHGQSATPSQAYPPSSTIDFTMSAQGQKHVAFVPEEPDQFVFHSKDHSGSTDRTGSPDLKRAKHTGAQQHPVSTGASPSFPSLHLDDSPGSVSGVSSNSVHRPFHPSTPDGVNAQSHITDQQSDITTRSNTSVATVTRVGGTKRPEVLSGSVQLGGDLGQLAQVVRSIVQEELGNFKTDMRTVVREEIDDMLYEVHSDIVNLQAQMMIQFEIQHTEMLTLFQQYSVNYELVSEIERLQEEVKRLKKHF